MSTYERRRRVPSTPAGRPAVVVDPEKIGRSLVRRRARSMTHTQAAAAVEEAQILRRQDLRHEESADDGGRGEAELVEWTRIVQLVAATAGPWLRRLEQQQEDRVGGPDVVDWPVPDLSEVRLDSAPAEVLRGVRPVFRDSAVAQAAFPQLLGPAGPCRPGTGRSWLRCADGAG
jgi:hypothetical protein